MKTIHAPSCFIAHSRLLSSQCSQVSTSKFSHLRNSLAYSAKLCCKSEQLHTVLAMGSVGNQNPWAPYDNYRDCSQEICSIYCPQFCYLVFPPPPPSDDSGAPFSPLIIAIIGVLATAFLLVSYYTIVTRYWKRRTGRGVIGASANRDESSQDQWQVVQTGLDEAMIKMITVCKYKKGDGLIEGTDCAVCLSEFQENESLRLLPKCSHAFHLPCIDSWLRSQSNCPLCRATVVAFAYPSPPAAVGSQTQSVANGNSYEIQSPDELVLVVDDQGRDCNRQMVVINDADGHRHPKIPIRDNGNGSVGGDEEGVEQCMRSVSLGTFSSRRQLLISDILRFEEIDEYMQLENNQLWRGVGCSNGVGGLLRNPEAMTRSISRG